jgi:hypothetical protein
MADVNLVIETLKRNFHVRVDYSDLSEHMTLIGSMVQLQAAQAWLRQSYGKQRKMQQRQLMRMTTHGALRGNEGFADRMQRGPQRSHHRCLNCGGSAACGCDGEEDRLTTREDETYFGYRGHPHQHREGRHGHHDQHADYDQVAHQYQHPDYYYYHHHYYQRSGEGASSPNKIDSFDASPKSPSQDALFEQSGRNPLSNTSNADRRKDEAKRTPPDEYSSGKKTRTNPVRSDRKSNEGAEIESIVDRSGADGKNGESSTSADDGRDLDRKTPAAGHKITGGIGLKYTYEKLDLKGLTVTPLPPQKLTDTTNTGADRQSQRLPRRGQLPDSPASASTNSRQGQGSDSAPRAAAGEVNLGDDRRGGLKQRQGPEAVSGDRRGSDARGRAATSAEYVTVRERWHEDNESPPATTTAELDYHIAEYLIKCEHAKVRKIETEFGVVVGRGKRLSDEIVTVTFRLVLPLKDVSNQEEKARDAFVDLMQAAYSQVIQRVVPVDVGSSPAETWMSNLTLVEQSINRTYPNVLVVAGVGSPAMTVIGPFDYVTQLEATIKSYLKIMTNRSSGQLWRGEDDDHLDEFYPDDRGSDENNYLLSVGCTDRTSEVDRRFDRRLTVRIYTANITHLNVDAIVNAGNSSLENWAGVAGDIERAGGAELREDCRNLIAREGPLKVSQAS